MSSDSEGESCDGYESERSEEEQPNSEDERFIASSDDESSGSDYEPDHLRQDAETFHKEAMAAVHAMRQRRRERRKRYAAANVVLEKAAASLSRPVQRRRRLRIPLTGKRWTKQWWKKDTLKKVKEKRQST